MTGLHAALDALAGKWETEAAHPTGHPLLVQVYGNLAREVRALLDEHPADLPVATDSTTAERDAWQNGLPVVDMSQQELDALLDYSTSLPTGKTIGKRWKRRLFAGPKAGAWVLGEYVEDPNPELVAIVWHEIRVLPAPAPEPSDSTAAALIERSSFGTPEAVALRASVSDEVAARVVARAKELEADAPAPAPEPSDRAELSETEWASIRALFIAAADEAEGEPEDVIPLDLRQEIGRILADRLAVAEQEATTLRAQVAAVGNDLIEARARCADLSDYAGRHKARADAAEQQVVAVEVLAKANQWEASEDRPGGVALLNPRDVLAALGGPGPWVDRVKAEGGVEALEQAADALKPRPGKPCERPENCCGTAAQCDAVVPMARVAGEGWLRERARVLRDGEPS
ncbi:hypothetical protein ACIRN4_06275 [Pimelobacter simplex]|uniref:hypothetical protein n=1 Tax=Nocardioides simplex TaxID=2045 RepID=UPI003801B555